MKVESEDEDDSESEDDGLGSPRIAGGDGYDHDGELIKVQGEAQFRQYAMSQTLSTLVVVDICATWCPASVALEPHLKRLAKKYKEKAIILQVNTDKQRDGGRWCQKYQQENAVPELQFYKKGKLLVC